MRQYARVVIEQVLGDAHILSVGQRTRAPSDAKRSTRIQLRPRLKRKAVGLSPCFAEKAAEKWEGAR